MRIDVAKFRELLAKEDKTEVHAYIKEFTDDCIAKNGKAVNIKKLFWQLGIVPVEFDVGEDYMVLVCQKEKDEVLDENRYIGVDDQACVEVQRINYAIGMGLYLTKVEQGVDFTYHLNNDNNRALLINDAVTLNVGLCILMPEYRMRELVTEYLAEDERMVDIEEYYQRIAFDYGVPSPYAEVRFNSVLKSMKEPMKQADSTDTAE